MSNLTGANCDQNHSSRYIFENFSTYFYSWYTLVLILIGTIGCVLCLVVIVRYNVFTSSTRYWFLAITVSDLLLITLCATDMYAVNVFQSSYMRLLEKSREFGCQIRISLIVSLSWMSNILQTGLSIERMVSIVTPLRARTLFTKGKTKITVLVIVLFCLVGGTTNTVTTLEFRPVAKPAADGPIAKCTRMLFNSSLDITSLVYNIDLFVFRLLPYSVMLLCSLVIIVMVRQNQAARKCMVHNHQQTSNNSSARESRMSLLLLAMNITLLLTNPVFLIFELWDGAHSEGKEFGKLTGDHCVSLSLSKFFNTLIYLNNQTNWIFYVAVGSRFRQRFVRVLCRLLCFCCWNQEASGMPAEDRSAVYSQVPRKSELPNGNRLAVYGDLEHRNSHTNEQDEDDESAIHLRLEAKNER